jgi:hypothetical protein
MALDVGTRLGPYEVLAPLGAGGMSACGYADAVARGRHSEASASGRDGGGAPSPVQNVDPEPIPE